jgi:hypothetical protein
VDAALDELLQVERGHHRRRRHLDARRVHRQVAEPHGAELDGAAQLIDVGDMLRVEAESDVLAQRRDLDVEPRGQSEVRE